MTTPLPNVGNAFHTEPSAQTTVRRPSVLQRLRSRSPLNSPRFWKWAVVVVLAAFVFDLARGCYLPTSAADSKSTTAEHAGDGGSEQAEEHGAGHSDPVAPVLLAIVLILFLAKTVGHLFEKYGLPAVLGELTVGIVLGNLSLVGVEALDPYFKLPTFEWFDTETFEELAKGDEKELVRQIEQKINDTYLYNTAVILKILAGIGVILLLFEVGLESTVREMMSVGMSSLLVAVLGVIAPMVLGWWVAAMLVPPHNPDTDWMVHAFVGATLCATSVGITARVLKDLGKSQERESQIILGAAVIDDVLGLVVLAVVAGIIGKMSAAPAGASLDLTSVAENVGLIVLKAIAFLLGAIFLGAMLFARPLFRTASFLRGHGLLVATALVICFGFSWLANVVGLAPIVGAFAAGLILEKTHYRELGQKEDHSLEEALGPLTAMLVPIFFVQMGTQVDLNSFADSSVWALAGAITVAAVLGKQVCSLGVLEKGLNRLSIGLGMIPRGEVGLIFAGVGRGLTMLDPNGDRIPVIDKATFSAVVVMVMITTMVTPPLLKWAMTRGNDALSVDQEEGDDS